MEFGRQRVEDDYSDSDGAVGGYQYEEEISDEYDDEKDDELSDVDEKLTLNDD